MILVTFQLWSSATSNGWSRCIVLCPSLFHTWTVSSFAHAYTMPCPGAYALCPNGVQAYVIRVWCKNQQQTSKQKNKKQKNKQKCLTSFVVKDYLSESDGVRDVLRLVHMHLVHVCLCEIGACILVFPFCAIYCSNCRECPNLAKLSLCLFCSYSVGVWFEIILNTSSRFTVYFISGLRFDFWIILASKQASGWFPSCSFSKNYLRTKICLWYVHLHWNGMCYCLFWNYWNYVKSICKCTSVKTHLFSFLDSLQFWNFV